MLTLIAYSAPARAARPIWLSVKWCSDRFIGTSPMAARHNARPIPVTIPACDVASRHNAADFMQFLCGGAAHHAVGVEHAALCQRLAQSLLAALPREARADDVARVIVLRALDKAAGDEGVDRLGHIGLIHRQVLGQVLLPGLHPVVVVAARHHRQQYPDRLLSNRAVGDALL